MYKVIKGINNDKLSERHEPGDTVDLKGWTKKQIKWLLEKGVVVEVKPKKGKNA